MATRASVIVSRLALSFTVGSCPITIRQILVTSSVSTKTLGILSIGTYGPNLESVIIFWSTSADLLAISSFFFNVLCFPFYHSLR